ncbi:hypothetical protein ABB02_00988 [Clostridiaceae bacterium JG1575]|nr:hypothetical protein ABB02_00988 [Clostridiaceae bacterium JG1575]
MNLRGRKHRLWLWVLLLIVAAGCGPKKLQEVPVDVIREGVTGVRGLADLLKGYPFEPEGSEGKRYRLKNGYDFYFYEALGRGRMEIGTSLGVRTPFESVADLHYLQEISWRTLKERTRGQTENLQWADFEVVPAQKIPGQKAGRRYPLEGGMSLELLGTPGEGHPKIRIRDAKGGLVPLEKALAQHIQK